MRASSGSGGTHLEAEQEGKMRNLRALAYGVPLPHDSYLNAEGVYP